LVVGDVEFAVDIEYRERQALGFDPECGAWRDLVGAAEFEAFGDD
jgi:hypothetical protein